MRKSEQKAVTAYWHIAIRDKATGEVFSAPTGIHADLLDHIPNGHPFVVGYIAPGGQFKPRWKVNLVSDFISAEEAERMEVAEEATEAMAESEGAAARISDPGDF
jgi:hypothetical protein